MWVNNVFSLKNEVNFVFKLYLVGFAILKLCFRITFSIIYVNNGDTYTYANNITIRISLISLMHLQRVDLVRDKTFVQKTS